jgi:hypothetical protein
MATFSTMTLGEAQTAVLPPRRATQELYRQYVRQLTPETAGRLELVDGDRSITERARLKAAAKSEGVSLHIQRKGDTIVFWQTEESPKSSGKGRGRTRSK